MGIRHRPGPADRDSREAVLGRRVRFLVAATISYNVVEAVVAVGAGTVASSTALIGFGLDSVIEVSSAAAVAWQFSGRDPKSREKKALRFIAFAFFALAIFVTVGAVRSLSGAGEAEHSTVGIVLAAVSLAVMPFLSLAQRRAGRELGSRSAVADSRQTLLCTYLSGVLLLGLVLNSTLGWSWADPVAALIIAALALKEGLDAWKGESCCTPVTPAFKPLSQGRAREGVAAIPPKHSNTVPLMLTARAGSEGGTCGCCQNSAQPEPAIPTGNIPADRGRQRR